MLKGLSFFTIPHRGEMAGKNKFKKLWNPVKIKAVIFAFLK